MATCATTSPLPKTRRDRGCAAPLCRKAGAGADTNAAIAGMSPKRSAASTVTATVNISTRASSGMSRCGEGPGDLTRHHDPHQHRRAESRADDTQDAPHRGEEQRFGQHLPSDAEAAAPSETRPAISCCRAAPREQQAADVDARQQQHAADHRHQQQQRPAELLMQRGRESGARRRDIDYDPEPLRISLCKGVDSARSSTRISARACSIDTPGLSRAASASPARDRMASGTAESEIQTSGR